LIPVLISKSEPLIFSEVTQGHLRKEISLKAGEVDKLGPGAGTGIHFWCDLRGCLSLHPEFLGHTEK
jgi:hypothetical protein